MLEGSLRINTKNYEDGYICAADGGHDILIKGVRSRCRALNGDVVVVKLEPAWEWWDRDLGRLLTAASFTGASTSRPCRTSWSGAGRRRTGGC
jgi:hypothetical protein